MEVDVIPCVDVISDVCVISGAGVGVGEGVEGAGVVTLKGFEWQLSQNVAIV